MSQQSDENFPPTPTVNLALPTTIPELNTAVSQHGALLLRWIQESRRAQETTAALRQENAVISQTATNLQIDLTNCQNQVAALNSHIHDLDETITKHEQEGETANTVIEELRSKLLDAERLSTAQQTLVGAIKSEKMPDPPIFHGDQKQIRGWMADMNMKLLVNADRYLTTQSQLAYIVSRTGGNAKEQLLPYVRNGQVDFLTTEACFHHLTTAFDDPDRKATALQKLRGLKQRNKPFNEYLAEFQRYVTEVDYNDEAKKNTLMGGLSDELQDLIVTQEEPSTYNAAVAILQKLDSKRRARNMVYTYTRKQTPRPALPTNQNQQQHADSYRSIPRPQYQGPTLIIPQDPDAMDLSQVQGKHNSSRSDPKGPRGPISDVEKQRRINDNDCLYCGKPGHYARDCPKKRSPLHAHAAETTPTPTVDSQPENGQSLV
jgi:hypothetical protein